MASIQKSTGDGDGGDERVWKVVSTGSALLAGVVTRKLLESVWKKFRSGAEGDPPLNPADRRISWADALAWAISASVAVGVGRLVAERLSAAGWERATGSPPPGIED